MTVLLGVLELSRYRFLGRAWILLFMLFAVPLCANDIWNFPWFLLFLLSFFYLWQVFFLIVILAIVNTC